LVSGPSLMLTPLRGDSYPRLAMLVWVLACYRGRARFYRRFLRLASGTAGRAEWQLELHRSGFPNPLRFRGWRRALR
jgi:hypothetical protein